MCMNPCLKYANAMRNTHTMNAAAATPAATNVARLMCPVTSRLRNASTNHSGTNNIVPSGTANTAATNPAFTAASLLLILRRNKPRTFTDLFGRNPCSICANPWLLLQIFSAATAPTRTQPPTQLRSPVIPRGARKGWVRSQPAGRLRPTALAHRRRRCPRTATAGR